MVSKAYYNENDSFAAAWLNNLQRQGLITAGRVDDRSILDVQGSDLDGYDRCHFFAGIGGWDYALALAGWPSDWSVWTGSCPCQPFSNAGKRKGEDDERHLWPDFRRLIADRRPPVVFGEQVASKDGRLWLDGVRTDLEALGYAVGAADLCSAGVGAPHIRQRLYWVANSNEQGGSRRGIQRHDQGNSQGLGATLERSAGFCEVGSGLEHAESHGRDTRRTEPDGWSIASGRGESQGLVDADEGLEGRAGVPERPDQRPAWSAGLDNLRVVECEDGFRRIGSESGDEPLAYGLPRSVGKGSTRTQRMELMAAKACRVGQIKGYGNAIDPRVASEFVAAFLETIL